MTFLVVLKVLRCKYLNKDFIFDLYFFIKASLFFAAFFFFCILAKCSFSLDFSRASSCICLKASFSFLNCSFIFLFLSIFPVLSVFVFVIASREFFLLLF